jgi:ABC-type protease/lipase transport system fused ATPase/permease subunit
VALGVVRIVLVLGGLLFALQIHDRAIGSSGSWAMSVLAGAAVLTVAMMLHLGRVWVASARADRYWIAARTDLFLAPVIVLTGVLMHQNIGLVGGVILGVPALLSFGVRDATGDRRGWHALRALAAVLAGTAVLEVGTWRVLAGEMTAGGLIVGSVLAAWLVLIGLFDWRRPRDA